MFLKNIWIKNYKHYSSARLNSTNINNYDYLLRQRALYNLNLLINNNRSSFLVQQLKDKLEDTTNNNINLHYINEQINKIFLSYSIHEALTFLKKTSNNHSKIEYYQHQFNIKYYNNDDLHKLFTTIENDILKNNNSSKIDILPFYYHIYIASAYKL